MIRGLLADRFKSVIRVENKSMLIYALTVASGGPKLQKSAITEENCFFVHIYGICIQGMAEVDNKAMATFRTESRTGRTCRRELEHGAERAVHRKHGRLAPYVTTPSATEHHAGREPLSPASAQFSRSLANSVSN